MIFQAVIYAFLYYGGTEEVPMGPMEVELFNYVHIQGRQTLSTALRS